MENENKTNLEDKVTQTKLAKEISQIISDGDIVTALYMTEQLIPDGQRDAFYFGIAAKINYQKTQDPEKGPKYGLAGELGEALYAYCRANSKYLQGKNE